MKYNYIFYVFLCIIITLTLNAYKSEDELTVALVGKIAKFIEWPEKSEKHFQITVLKNPFGDLFEKTYANRKIKNQKVAITYIEKIEDLGNPSIFFVPQVPSNELKKIIDYTVDKKILLISNARAFAEKGGAIQVYFTSQKPRLKINLERTNKQEFEIKSSLLRIAEVLRPENGK